MKNFKRAAGFIVMLTMTAACSRPPATDGGITTEAGTSTNIIGGTPVETDDPILRSTVGIVDLRRGAIICTGSLVTPNMVVTAAHCTTLNPRHLAIAFTSIIPKTREEARATTLLPVVAGKTSPQWPLLKRGQKGDWGDVAVLRFLGTVPEGYSPAKILASPEALVNDEKVLIAGFGWTDGIKKTPTDVMRKTEVKIRDAAFSSTEVMFDQTEGTGACHGDSGGPAFVKVDGELVLFGVTSRGYNDPFDTCARYSIYTNLATQLEWLQATVTELSQVQRTSPMPQPSM